MMMRTDRVTIQLWIIIVAPEPPTELRNSELSPQEIGCFHLLVIEIQLIPIP